MSKRRGPFTKYTLTASIRPVAGPSGVGSASIQEAAESPCNLSRDGKNTFQVVHTRISEVHIYRLSYDTKHPISYRHENRIRYPTNACFQGRPIQGIFSILDTRISEVHIYRLSYDTKHPIPYRHENRIRYPINACFQVRYNFNSRQVTVSIFHTVHTDESNQDETLHKNKR